MLTVVTGVPRSGTSMMMGMLEAGGIDCLYEPGAGTEANPLGNFEYPAALRGDPTIFAQAEGKAVKILAALPSLDATGFDLRLIVMRRRLEAALASRAAIDAHQGRPTVDRAAFVTDQLDAVRLWAAGKAHIEVWYEDVLRNPANECLRVLMLLYPDHDRMTVPPLDLAAMAATVRPDLDRHGHADV